MKRFRLSVTNRKVGQNADVWISRFERRSEIALGVLALVNLVYAILQQVVFANAREIVPNGTQLANVLSDLATGFVVSYIFYLLVVVRPAIHNRRTTYGYVQTFTARIVDDARSLSKEVAHLSGVPASGPWQRTQFVQALTALPPLSPVRMVDPNLQPFSAFQFMLICRQRTITNLDKVEPFFPFVDSELMSILAEIEHSPYFVSLEAIQSLGSQFSTFQGLADTVADYLEMAEKLNAYGKAHVAPATSNARLDYPSSVWDLT